MAIAVSKASTNANTIIDMVLANFAKQNNTASSANALIVYRV